MIAFALSGDICVSMVSKFGLFFIMSTDHLHRLAQGIFLVYDITSERSFQHIMKWASDVDEVSSNCV